jgi:hypothetical protein
MMSPELSPCETNMAKKSTAIVPTMLRMREDLRQRLEREAKKRDHSLNAEMVHRLEQSFVVDEKSRRDGEIIDMLVRNKDVSSQLLRDIYDGIAKHPDWDRDEAARKDLLSWLAFAIYGKEPPQEPRSGEEL